MMTAADLRRILMQRDQVRTIYMTPTCGHSTCETVRHHICHVELLSGLQVTLRRNEDAVGRMGRHSAFCSQHRIRGGSKAAAARRRTQFWTSRQPSNQQYPISYTFVFKGFSYFSENGSNSHWHWIVRGFHSGGDWTCRLYTASSKGIYPSL